LPGCSRSRAAFYSYTTYLILFFEDTSLKVFQLITPLVDTEFSKEIGCRNGIKAAVVADEFIAAISKHEYEIHFGDTAKI